MYTFYEWLGQLSEDRNRTVAPEVLQSYDMEMRRQLQQMATRIHDPHLRAQFLELLDCPLVDAKGRCRTFGDYVLGALLKSGLDNRYDLEQVGAVHLRQDADASIRLWWNPHDAVLRL